jgi:hypothetical protein
MRTALCLVLLILPARAVIVDRVAVIVGSKVITDSEIMQRIRLAAFQNDEMPDFSLASRQRAAQTLIDQKVVEREMDVGHFPRQEELERKELLEAYIKSNYHSDPEALKKAAAGYGLTPDEVATDLARQSELLTFLSLRFRPAVQVTDQDVQKYFTEKLGATAQPADLNEKRAQIEQLLTDERADMEMDRWLADQRTRTKLEYPEKELEPPDTKTSGKKK